jgi:Na+-driven multidrug efflux pump
MNRTLIVRQLALVALPILLSSLTGLLVPIVNAGVLARDATTNLYVLGIFLPISFLQSSLYESLRVAAIAFAARGSGSGNMYGLRQRLQALLALGPIILALLAAAFWIGRDAFLTVYQVPVEEQGITATFIAANLLFGGLVVVSINMMSALYGLGRAYSVTFVTIAGFALNVGLTALLVAVTRLGLYALLVSTFTSATLTIAWAGFQLARRGALGWPGLEWLDGLRQHFREISALSLPVLAGFLILFVQTSLFNRLLAQFSPADVASFGVAFRIQSMVLMPAIAMGIALAYHINRLAASAEHGEVHRFLSTSICVSLSIFVAMAALVFLGREALPRLVTQDADIVDGASRYLSYMGPAYAVLGPLLTLLIFFEETGNGLRSLSFNAVSVAIQLTIAFALVARFHSLDLVYQVIAASYCIALAYIGYELRRTRRLPVQQISRVSLR